VHKVVSKYSICWLRNKIKSKFDKIDTRRMVYIQATLGVGFLLINFDKAKLPVVEPIKGIKNRIIVDLSRKCKSEEFRSQKGYLK